MERIDNIDQSRVDDWRAMYAVEPGYEPYSEPLPGSFVKHDDDILWIDLFPVRVIWGTDNPLVFLAYGNDFGDIAMPLEAQYVTDRAPLDPLEQPMPIYPEEEEEEEEQQEQGEDRGDQHRHQMGARRRRRRPRCDGDGEPKQYTREEQRRILDETFKRLGAHTAALAQARIRASRPELFEKDC